MPKFEERLRYENKYIVTGGQAELLKCHIEGLCVQDAFSGGQGEYKIRSLYFDDYKGNSYRDNEIGIEPRSKFRLRFYNDNPDIIFLEQKMKISGKIYKERTQVTADFYNLLVGDKWEKADYPTSDALLNRFWTAYHTRGLKPRIIIEYDREPFVCPEGDVRITLDKGIAFSDEVENYLRKDLFLQPIMKTGGELLEMKYQNFIPDFLYQGIQLRQLQQYTFSKFYLCEMYRRSGGV